MSQSSGYSYDRESKDHDSWKHDKDKNKDDDARGTEQEEPDRSEGDFSPAHEEPQASDKAASSDEYRSRFHLSESGSKYGAKNEIHKSSPKDPLASFWEEDDKRYEREQKFGSKNEEFPSSSRHLFPENRQDKKSDALPTPPDLSTSRFERKRNIESEASLRPSSSSSSFSSSVQEDSMKNEDMTNEERFGQILDLLGRLEDRLRRSDSEREETERDVQGLRESLDSLEDKYLRTDKAFFEIEGKVGRLDKVEEKLENINMADPEVFDRQISEVRELISTIDEKADNSERAFLKVDQKINSLQRQEEEWRESEEAIKRRQEVLEKSVHDSQKELEANIQEQQSGFEDILYQRQRDTEQRLNERQSEISQTQTEQDERLGVIEYYNRELSEKVDTSQSEQIRMIEKIDDILAQQNRINRRLDKAEQDKLRLQRKIDYLSDMVDRNNQALESKAMVLLTDQSVAESSNRPYVHPALRSRDIIRRGEEQAREEEDSRIALSGLEDIENGDRESQTPLKYSSEFDPDEKEPDEEEEENKIASALDEETPPETRLEERRVLTGKDESDEKSAEFSSKNEDESAFISKDQESESSNPFARQLKDFGDQEREDKSDTATETREAQSSEAQKEKALDLSRVRQTGFSSQEAGTRGNSYESKGRKNALIAGGVLAAVIFLGAIAAFFIQSSRQAEIRQLEDSIARADQENMITQNKAPVEKQDTLSSISDQQLTSEQLFDQQNASITSGVQREPESLKSARENSLREDEMAIQPGQKDQESAQPERIEDPAPSAPAQGNTQSEGSELARLSPELNRLEPSAPLVSPEPPKKPGFKLEDPAAPSPSEASIPDEKNISPRQDSSTFTGSFFDPMRDPALTKELEKNEAMIDAFLKSQPHGNLEQRIRPDATLSPIVRKIEEKAFQGIPEAQHDLAAIYTAGHAGTDQNFERAAFWFREAAVDGIDNARYNLGVLYHQGLGVKADLKTAIKWYKTASMVGHPEAQYNLGIAHIEGIGTQYRPKIAAYYFTKAARQDVPEAAYNLGLIYENGLTGKEHPEIALYWYNLAASQGNNEASKAFEQLKSRLGLNEKDAGKILNSISQYYGPRENGPNEQALSPTPEQGRPQLASFSDSPSNNSGAQEGSLVFEIQSHLLDLGYYPGPADGAFGPKTEDAIRSYQKDKGLEVTGLPSRALIDHMNKR